MAAQAAVMPLAQFPELQKLPKTQKLALAEELWCAAVDNRMPVSAAHKATLEARWKSYRSGKTKRISLKELERRLGRQ